MSKYINTGSWQKVYGVKRIRHFFQIILPHDEKCSADLKKAVNVWNSNFVHTEMEMHAISKTFSYNTMCFSTADIIK